MFSIHQGYYIVYKFMERYWYEVDRHRKYEPDDSFTLVTIFSTGMEPQDINISNPLDREKYYEWVELTSQINDKATYTKDELFTAMIKFLNYYKNEYGFNLKEAIDDIEHNCNVMWEKVITEAIETI